MEEGLEAEGDDGLDLLDQEAPDLAPLQPGSPPSKRLCLEYIGIVLSHDCCMLHRIYNVE